jgi:hypothetical protein
VIVEHYKLVIVLYSYSGRLERQQLLAQLCYNEISNIPGVRVLITKHRHEAVIEPLCFGILPIDTPKGYEFLPEKTIEMLQWVDEHIVFDYLLKCDDDIVLDPNAIRTIVENGLEETYFGIEERVLPVHEKELNYHRGKCQSEFLNSHGLDLTWAPSGFSFMSGTCYGLSSFAVKKAINAYKETGFDISAARARLDIRGVGAEDVLLSFLLQSTGVKGVESLRALHCPKRSVMLVKLLGDIKDRIAGRKMRLCVGVVTSNRMARKDEQFMLRCWQLFSKWLA